MLKIFVEASQHKVVPVCVLNIFDIAVRCMEVDLLVRTSTGNKNGVRCLELSAVWSCPLFGVVRCPLFGVVRCLEVFIIGILITNDPDLN